MGLFKKKKNKDKNISENSVKIEVFRLLGDNVPYSIAKFEAMQVRDSDNNLVLVNMSNSFKDDVEIVRHKLISDLEFTLELHKLGDKEKIETVQKRIKSQEDYIQNIVDGYYVRKQTEEEKKNKISPPKIKVNLIDEQNKLSKYKVFLESLEYNGEGSYEIIDSDGKKKVQYMYKEGILYPIKYVKSKTSMYPDVSTKRKTYKQEQDLIDQEYLNDAKGLLSGWKQYLFLALIVIMVIGNIYWSVKLYGAYENYDSSNIAELIDKAEGSAIKCAYWYATIGEETSGFVENYEKLIKERDTNNSKSVTVG